MELCVFVEPQQGTTYDTVLALASTAERLGFTGFFTSDHYLVMGDGDGLPGPLDAWTTLAGLARDTDRLRLGTLMTAAPFRRPGPFTIAVTQVDHMSGGRVELGIGAGWYEAEYGATGVPFGTMGERFDILEETLAIVHGWWTTPAGTAFRHDGELFQVEGPALPKPVQAPHPPIIIGGGGPKRTPNLVARYANEYNGAFTSVDDTAAAFARIRAACEEHGRDPDELKYSVANALCLGADEAGFHARASAIGRDPDEIRTSSIAGLPHEVAERIRQYRDEAGVQRVYLQALNITEPDQLDLFAAEVLPLLS